MGSMRKLLAAKLEKAQAVLEKVDHVTSLLVQAQNLRGPALLGLSVRATQMIVEHVKPGLTKKVTWPYLPVSTTVAHFLVALLGPLEVTSESCGYSLPGPWKFFRLRDKGVAILCESGWSVRVHVQETDLELFWSAIRELSWMRTGPTMTLVSVEHGFQVQTHQGKPPKPSPRAGEIWERLEPFLREGDSRFLVLDGRPGTGKTVLAEELAHRAETLFGEARALHIPMNELSIGSDTLLSVVSILRPTVVVINDFDRGFSQDLLSFLEDSRIFLRMLLVSVNNLKYLSAAMIRPGRFDEIFTIEGLGETFVQDFLGALWSRLSEAERSQVLRWPVAYLEELRLRGVRRPHAQLGPEVEDLEKRLAPRETPEWAERLVKKKP